jgi:hypothetical protein
MKRHEPHPPLLLTMIMNAIVIPRTTSRDSSLGEGSGRCKGVVIAVRARSVRKFHLDKACAGAGQAVC